jgi:hypothetical protein
MVRVAVLVLACVLLICGPAAAADLGPNVKVLDPSMSTAQIKAIVDPIADQQVPDQFGEHRYAILFKPGTYGTPEDPLNFQVGYYTEVAGLGASPDDVVVNGTIDVYNQCFGPNDCTALVNFWRSLSNLRLDVAGKDGCQVGEFWATSQAAPMRRVDVNGAMTLMDYCSQPSYASGGYIADSRVSSTIVNGSQQQYLVRNSEIGGWSNGVWNQVFAGVQGAPAQSFPDPPYTTLATNPRSRERPFLRIDDRGRYSVYLPAVQRDSAGTTWAGGRTPGESIPLDRFFVARPGDGVKAINRALDRGKNLLFTPGVYDVARTIRVKRPGTVVMGLGMATLTAQNGAQPLDVAAGTDVSGLLIDAGAKRSRVLLHVRKGHTKAPTALHDVFFRIGGPHVGRAKVSLQVDADGAILDHIWAWRADHGDGVGWTVNTADTGVVINGDDVVATGLFVEHYQRYEVIWNGERGRTIMFQNEMPYDPPDQDAYRHGDTLGWASYKVANHVRTHEAWGLGSYSFFNVDPTIHSSHAYEVPVRPGVRLHDVLTLSITNSGTIDHVVNDYGPPTSPDTTTSNVVEYPPE